jgi:hypothetical protein
MFQDDQRESNQIRKFNLQKSPGRIGPDAIYKNTPVELKSTGGNYISTSRDTDLNHIRRWRNSIWIVDLYNQSVPPIPSVPSVVPSVIIPPDIINSWLDTIDEKILRLLETKRKILDAFKDDPDLPLILSMTRRGGMINNPKIPVRLLKNLPKIYHNHPDALEEFYQNYRGSWN